MTAEQHYKEWYAEKQGIRLTSDHLISLDKDMINVIKSFAKQESIEFAKWVIDEEYCSVVQNGERLFYHPCTSPKLTTEDLYEKYQQSKEKQ